MLSKACVVGTYQGKAAELARVDGVELTVVVPSSWRDAGRTIHLERTHTSGYSLIELPIHLNGYHHLHFYRGLASLVHRLQPDIVHIDEEPYSLVTFQAMRLARSAGARTLFFTWQNIYRRYPPPFSWWERYNLTHADYAIAGNQAAVAVWRRKGYRGPIAVIPQFGVDPELFRKEIGVDRASGEVAPVIGFAGRLVAEKGVDLLLQAIAGLAGNVTVRIAGAGPLRRQLETLAHELGLAGQVQFSGPLSSTEMPRWLNGLDVLVLPSLSRPSWKEQFGRVLIEAMACEVPVVGSSCGEIPNVIGEAGLVFAEGDVDGLRDSLKRLLADAPLRQHLGRLGRERVLAHYTQAQIAAATHEVYRELLSGYPVSRSGPGR